MQLILQSPGTKMCGQCSVAMATGKSLKEVVAVMGRRGTTPPKVIEALTKLGFGTTSGYYQKDAYPTDDMVAIVGVKSPFISQQDWGGHWVVWNRGKIIDPAGHNVAGMEGMKLTYVIVVKGGVE